MSVVAVALIAIIQHQPSVSVFPCVQFVVGHRLRIALRRKREATDRIALSPREHEILVLLHDGLSVPAIAAQLFVSLSTAKTYVARLYDKLGARNRAQALMTAVRLGMFEGHQPRHLNAVG